MAGGVEISNPLVSLLETRHWPVIALGVREKQRDDDDDDDDDDGARSRTQFPRWPTFERCERFRSPDSHENAIKYDL